jgi:hypothetical protein
MANTPSVNYLPTIQRRTPDDRVLEFTNKSNSIYNKFSIRDQTSGNQPYVYTKLTDSKAKKELTRYDTQALPVGSTIRDVQRIGTFMMRGEGVIFVGKQYALQTQNAFNETRIYNPLSVIGAVSKPGLLGITDRSNRHVRTSGGLLNFFKDSMLDSIGFQTKDWNKEHIEGTAGDNSNSALSQYVKNQGGASTGLLRLHTSLAADSRFSQVWTPSTTNSTQGFLTSLGNALKKTLTRYIPTTNPMGIFGGSPTKTWKYRIEYPDGGRGIYQTFLDDTSKLLTVKAPIVGTFYTDGITNSLTEKSANTLHRFTPDSKYATNLSSESSIGKPRGGANVPGNLAGLYDKYLDTIVGFTDQPIQQRRSLERYSTNTEAGVTSKNNYESIKAKRSNTTSYTNTVKDEMTLDKRSFARHLEPDTYNTLSFRDTGSLGGPRNKIPEKILTNDNQSTDVILFYFYDLINKLYIPFRATLTGVMDQHSAQWEEISYLGRADKLFIYKGFTRDANFSFKVYANSVKELVPMWERINYLVGLTRPSKYTELGIQTNASVTRNPDGSVEVTNINQEEEGNISFGETGYAIPATGRESRFMYPPMVAITIGDLYTDQPAIISGVNISIPDDVNWESYRGDVYRYNSGLGNVVEKAARSRQLPLQADIAVQVRLFERKLSLGSNYHFGRKETGWDVV